MGGPVASASQDGLPSIHVRGGHLVHNGALLRVSINASGTVQIGCTSLSVEAVREIVRRLREIGVDIRA
jgi:hypothetical protein